jgi:REP element-mobilizing transposase RayT
MPKEYHHASHSKYLLHYHFVFACKYRKKLLGKQNVADEIKSLFTGIAEKSGCSTYPVAHVHRHQIEGAIDLPHLEEVW